MEKRSRIGVGQSGQRRMTRYEQFAWVKQHVGKAMIALLVLFVSFKKADAATTVTLSTPSTVAAGTLCPGTSQRTIYEFTLVATGIFPTTTLTGISFTQSGTATSSDIIRYQLWDGAPGGTLLATSTTTAFTGLSTVYNGLTATTVNYTITADFTSTATAGRTVIVAPMTTGDFTTTSGFKATFGTIAGGGTQGVLLAPSGITGVTSVCAGSSVSLANSVGGGTWTSSAPGIATVDAVTGLLSGVAAGTSTITYQLSTGCLKTTTATVNPLPVVNTVTGGGNYCSGGAGVHVGLSGSTTGIYYQLYCGAATPADLTGNGSALDFGLQTSAGVYSVIATNTTTSCSRTMSGTVNVSIDPLPTAYAMTGGGSYCSGGSGVHIGLAATDMGINYRLYNGATATGAPVAGTGSAIDFGMFTASGTYTVLATNAVTSCTNSASGSAPVTINALPNVYSVFGGGSYCAGGTGVHVRLSWSQVGVMYILYNGTTAIGSPVPGTGLLLDLGEQTAPGTYTVVAMNATTFCTRNMSGSATVVVNPLPTAYSVTGGGNYCSGGAGVHVGLSSSATGISYMLYNGSTVSGSPLSGTGAALDFGLQTAAGTYTVLAVNSSTSCMNNMAGAANVVINPLPTVYSVTGGGAYCSGGGGTHVGLGASNTGISYQLYNGSTATGTPVSGTGSAIDFGLQTAAGIYTVRATNSTTMCINDMAGSASVLINPLPTVYAVTGGGYYCTTEASDSVISAAAAGTTEHHVGLAGSQVGVIYLLQNGLVTVGSPVAGTGSAIDFGVQYVAGHYTVLAINSTTLCTQGMSGSATIDIHPVVVPIVTIIPDGSTTVCQGSPINFNTVTTNGGTAPTYQWKVNSVAVDTGADYSYTPANNDTVSVTLTSNAICASPVTATNRLTMTVILPVVPSVTIAADPGTSIVAGQSVTFTATTTSGGTSPRFQWYLNSAALTGATLSTYTSSTLANNDSVSCKVTRNDACALSSHNSLKMTVTGVGVTDTRAEAGSYSVMPNPSNGSFTLRATLPVSANTDVNLEIVNLTGQVVFSKVIQATNGSVNEAVSLPGQPAGVYILNIRTAEERKMIQLVIE